MVNNVLFRMEPTSSLVACLLGAISAFTIYRIKISMIEDLKLSCLLILFNVDSALLYFYYLPNLDHIFF